MSKNTARPKGFVFFLFFIFLTNTETLKMSGCMFHTETSNSVKPEKCIVVSRQCQLVYVQSVSSNTITVPTGL